MSESAKPKPRITPARPAESDESAGYMPRLPWRWILIGTLSVCTVMGGYLLNERRKADRLRSQIVQVHEDALAEPARRYLEFRDKLEGWITSAAQKAPDGFADPRLRVSGLRSGKGLYLRLPAAEAASRAGIRKSAVVMQPDSIPSCLGIAPASARGLWEKGEFLTPEWLAKKRKDDSVMHLRVTDTVLARHIRADLPNVLNLLRSDWFLLVLQHGDNRRDQPVDVFLWDVKSGESLLRGRIQASGVLLSARVSSKDAPPAPRLTAERVSGAAAHDCSIAAHIKELAGLPIATVQNVQPPPPPAAAPQAAETAPAAAEPGQEAPAAAQPQPPTEPATAPGSTPGEASP